MEGQANHGKHRAFLRLTAVCGIAFAAIFGAGCASNPAGAARAFAASGQRYLAQKRFSSAAIQFRNALKREPADWKARYGLAQAESNLAEWPAYYRDLNAVIKAQPNFVPARLDLAELDLMGAQTVLAQEQINRVLQFDPKSVRAQVVQMKLDLSAKHLHRALKQCDRLRSLLPKSDSVYGMCGLANIGLRQYPAAAADFQQAIAFAPASATDQRNLANVLVLEGHPRQAQAVLVAAAKRYPRSLAMQLVLADFYVRHGQLPAADAVLSRAVSQRKPSAQLSATLGEFWMNHNDLHRAIANYQKSESLHPSLLTEENLASAYLTLSQLPEARHYVQVVLRQHPHNVNGQALEGAVECVEGHYAKAETELQDAMKADPQSILAKFYLGMVWQATGQLDRAKQAFTDCIQMNDKFLQAYVRLGQLALQSGDWRLGAAYAREIYQTNPRSADAYLLLAQADMMHGEMEPAGRIIAASEQIPDAPVQVHQLAARFDVLENRLPAANHEMQLVMGHSSNPIPLVEWYAWQLAGTGHTAQAIASVQQLAGNASNSPDIHALLASLYLKAGQLAPAETAANQALAQNPQMAGGHIILGQIYQRQGKLEKAGAEYAEAIQLNRNDEQGYLSAGGLLLGQGHYGQAERIYQSALAQASESDPAKLGLAESMADAGSNLDQALSIAQQLKARYPENPEVADVLGWIYHQKGLQPLAIPQLELAARGMPRNSLVLFHLGITLMDSGQKARGRALLSQAIRSGLDPRDQRIAQRELRSEVALK